MKTILLITLSLLCMYGNAFGNTGIPYTENGVKKEYRSIPNNPSDEFIKKFFKACISYRQKVWPEWGKNDAAERKRNLYTAESAIDETITYCYNSGYRFNTNKYNEIRNEKIAIDNKAGTFRNVKRVMYKYTLLDKVDLWENSGLSDIAYEICNEVYDIGMEESKQGTYTDMSYIDTPERFYHLKAKIPVDYYNPWDGVDSRVISAGEPMTALLDNLTNKTRILLSEMLKEGMKAKSDGVDIQTMRKLVVDNAIEIVSEYIEALPVENPETWKEELHRVIFSDAFNYGVNGTPQKLINAMQFYQTNANELRKDIVKRFGAGKIVNANKYRSKMTELFKGSGPSYIVRLIGSSAIEAYRHASYHDLNSDMLRYDIYVSTAVAFGRLGCTPDDFVIIIHDVEKIICRVFYYAIRGEKADMDALLSEIIAYKGLFGIPGEYDNPKVREGKKLGFEIESTKRMPDNYLNMRPHIWEPWAKYF